MSEKAPATPAINPVQPEQAVDPIINPNQGQLFDPAPLTPEQARAARFDAALINAIPAAQTGNPTEKSNPGSPEESQSDTINLPDELVLKRDWNVSEARQKQNQADHVAEVLESSTEEEAQALREKIAALNETKASDDSEAGPANAADKRKNLDAPLSPEDEEAHKVLLKYIKENDAQAVADMIPDSLKPKRDWNVSEADHKQKQADQVAEIASNLEARLAASSEAAEVQAYRQKVDKHNEAINARNTERVERKAAEQAYIDEQNAAADGIREEHIGRQKLLRGEAQAKLFEKEIQAEADAKVKEALGNDIFGKSDEESKAALDAAAKAHVEATLGAAKHAGEGVVDTDKLKAERKAKAEADEKLKYPEVKNVFYTPKPGEHGVVQTAAELTREGDGFDLNSLNDDGEALIYTDDRTYYVKGKDINDLMIHAKNLSDGGDRDDGKYFEDDEELPIAIVGQSMNVDGSPYGGPVTKIEVRLNKVNKDELDAADEEWEARGDDPFEAAREIIEKVDVMEAKLNGRKEKENPDAETPKGLRARVRSAMGKAAGKLRNLHDKAMVKILTGSAHELLYDEEKGKKRRRIAGGVLGAVALAAAVGGAYVASKSGVNVRPGGGNTAGNLAPLLPKPSLGNTIGDAIQHTGKSVEKAHQQAQQAAHAAAQAAQAHGTVMEIGPSTPTVSHMAVKELAAQGNLHPSLQEIQAKTAHELAINNITWPGARNMLDGTKVKIN